MCNYRVKCVWGLWSVLLGLISDLKKDVSCRLESCWTSELQGSVETSGKTSPSFIDLGDC